VVVLKDLYLEEKKKDNPRYSFKTFDEYFRYSSFDGEFGRIFCIGYAIDDNNPESISGDEKNILESFWQIAKDVDLFIGHNILDFDFRFIYKRSIISGVRPTQEISFARYRNSPIFDTMKEWDKWSNHSTSLHKLTIALGITSPKDRGIDGSKVYDFFLAGKNDEIIEYCLRDVEAVREIYKRICFLK
jgi:3'-5' exonuclease